MTINIKNFLSDKSKMSKMGEFQNLKQIEGLEMSAVSADLYGNGRDDICLFYFKDGANYATVSTTNSIISESIAWNKNSHKKFEFVLTGGDAATPDPPFKLAWRSPYVPLTPQCVGLEASLCSHCMGDDSEISKKYKSAANNKFKLFVCYTIGCGRSWGGCNGFEAFRDGIYSSIPRNC